MAPLSYFSVLIWSICDYFISVSSTIGTSGVVYGAQIGTESLQNINNSGAQNVKNLQPIPGKNVATIQTNQLLNNQEMDGLGILKLFPNSDGIQKYLLLLSIVIKISNKR